MAIQPIIIGNWKMHKTSAQAVEFIKALIPMVEESSALVWLAVPFTAIESAAKAAAGTNIVIGAQNMNEASHGAFTGEIAASMLKEAGAQFVLLGHSERRQIFHETDKMISAKVAKAVHDGITPVLCVGETEKERESGYEEVLQRQILEGFQGVDKEHFSKVVLAYEPVWAIGTGKTATPKMAEETHKFCRLVLAEHFGKKHSGSIPLLYGGSVKPDNISDLMKEKDINGALVGGAALEPKSFSQIVNYQVTP
jgi:triosephosphate isomerase (TIM)